jgi:3-dehydroquinate synthase
MSGTVIVNTGSGKYPVIIGCGLDFGKLTLDVKKPCRVVIVSDDIVYPLYGKDVMESFKKSGFQVSEYIIKNGESSKTLVTIEEMLCYLAKEAVTRGDMLVCLGGGVVGDITGFASAIYLRGISFIQIPTTILAAVDSSVGGKTGVDLSAGKNLVGAFHQPAAVFCDTDFFVTLPESVYSDGMAEIIKHCMAFDKELLISLDILSIAEICRKNVEIKECIVEQDEFDTGIRKKLNFGHTVGHAVEVLSDFQVSHGRAVAIGMTVISKASERCGLTDEPVTEELIRALKRYDLPVKCEYSAKELAGAALRDKKRSGDTITLVIPRKVGKVELYELPVSGLEDFIAKGLN